MNLFEIRQKAIDYYTEKGFVYEQSAPLIHPYFPMSFNMSAGFVQLEPYIRSKKEITNNKIVTVQKCIRHFDLDKAGLDDTHLSFFEMFGALTLGKTDRGILIKDLYEFLVSELKIHSSRLHITVFGGDDIKGKTFKKDEIAYESWKKLGIKDANIHIGNGSNTFWFQGGNNLDDKTKGSPFDVKLCGYQTEVFYELEHKEGDSPLSGSDNWIEIANILDIRFQFDPQKKEFSELDTLSTETVFGIERLSAVVNKKNCIWKIDELAKLDGFSRREYENNSINSRILIDRLRTLYFLSFEGIPLPGRNGRNKITKKILNDIFRILFLNKHVSNQQNFLKSIIESFEDVYAPFYDQYRMYSRNLEEFIYEMYPKYNEKLEHCINSYKQGILRKENPFELINEIEKNSYVNRDLLKVYLD